MLYRDHPYGVLIVSSAEQFHNKTAELLPAGDFWPVRHAKSAGEARRMLSERHFDVLIICSPLPDEIGTVLAEDACEDGSLAVLFLAPAEHYDELGWRLMERGILCVSRPLSTQIMLQSVRACCVMVERLRRLEEKQATVEEKIGEIRLVNRAKWVLIEQRGMSEEEAHRFIEKEAMDRRLPRRAVAEEILEQ